MLEARQLRYIVAIGDEGTITGAAERLGIQQPPLTRQVRTLEDRLGVQLLHRVPRGVELTEAGQLLADEGRAILSRLDGLVEGIRRAGRGEQGRLAVGFTSSAGFHRFVPELIRAFRQRWPGISLMLEENGTAELVHALTHGEVDAAFVRSPAGDASGLVIEEVLAEPMLVALHASHPLAGTDPAVGVPLSALSGETFILYRRPAGPGLYDAIILACVQSGFSPKIGQEAPRMLSTLSLVSAGMGVSVVPESMRRLDPGNVVYVPISESRSLVAPLQLAFARSNRSPALRRFRDMVHDAAMTLAPAARS